MKKIFIALIVTIMLGLYAYVIVNLSNIFASDEFINMNSKGTLMIKSFTFLLNDSNITGENLEFDTTYYPYYGLLDENQKQVYKQVYANVEALETTFIPVKLLTIDEIKEVMQAVYNDHPEFFYLNTSFSYKYTNDKKCLQIKLEFNELVNDLEYHKILFEKQAKTIIEDASKLETDYLKEKYVHDTIIKMVDYDTEATLSQSAYSALVNNKSVCAGYARAFQYIMIKLGIPTYYVEGITNEGHAWNIVKLDNIYYNVDLTGGDRRTIIYNFFNISDIEFSYTHTRVGMSKSLPECNGKIYGYLLRTN